MGLTSVNSIEFKRLITKSFYGYSVGTEIATMEERHAKMGDTITVYSQDEVSGGIVNQSTGAFTSQTLNQTSETVTINRAPSLAFNYTDRDKTLSITDFLEKAKKSGTEELLRMYDGDILGEVIRANHTFDNGNLTGGDANGTPITITTSNTIEVLTRAQVLVPQTERESGLFFIGTSDYFANLTVGLQANARATALGDQMVKNGMTVSKAYRGTFSGVDLYESTRLMVSHTLTFSGNASNGNTITIKTSKGNAVINLVTTLGSTAGNVLIGADAEATIENIASFLLNPTATTATQIGFSGDVATLEGRIATELYYANNDTEFDATTLTINYKGYTGSTVTESSSAITVGTKCVNNFMSKKGCVKVLIGKSILDGFQVTDMRSNKIAGEMISSEGYYGLKLLNEDAQYSVRIKTTK